MYNVPVAKITFPLGLFFDLFMLQIKKNCIASKKMNQSTPEDVINLPFIDAETNTSKRNRTGHNIFMMHCHIQFNTYSYQQRKNLLINHQIYNIDEYARHEQHPRRAHEPKYNYKIVNKVSNTIWKNALPPATKQAWNDRAIQLNALPPHGQYTTISNIINNQAAILNTLNYSFSNFMNYMHPLLKRDPRKHNTKMATNYSRMFGNERVIMGKQIFCSYFLNHLLHLIFFGEWDHHSFFPFEVIDATKNTKLIHIGSAKRLFEMTEVHGLSPFRLSGGYNNSQKYNETRFIAGKVVLMNGITYGEVVGYVCDEDRDTISVKIDSDENTEDSDENTEDGSVIVLLRPKYHKKEGKFEYFSRNIDVYKWVSYDPIRIKLSRRGQLYFTMNRITINKDDDVIVNI
jgi:hypothetical protein